MYSVHFGFGCKIASMYKDEVLRPGGSSELGTFWNNAVFDKLSERHTSGLVHASRAAMKGLKHSQWQSIDEAQISMGVYPLGGSRRSAKII